MQKIRGEPAHTREESVDDLSARLRDSYRSSHVDVKEEIKVMQQLQADVASQLNDLKGVLAQYKALQNQNDTGQASVKED